MSRGPGRIVAALGALGATVLVAAVSRAPMGAYPDPAPIVRLAWSVRPERIEACRTLTDEELADVPVHMRQRVQCEGRSARYRLTVRVDGTPRVDTTLTGGGARSDRPVYVFREVAVAEGEHHFEVRFEREALPRDSAGPEADERGPDSLLAGRAQREAQERLRRREEAVPPLMDLATSIAAEARTVHLVTYDIDRRTLVLRTGSGAP